MSKLGGFPNPSKEEQELARLEAENKKLRTENQTLRETLEAWQAVVRVAREKDSTLPDPVNS